MLPDSASVDIVLGVATAKLHNPELSALNSKISKYIGGQPIKVVRTISSGYLGLL